MEGSKRWPQLVFRGGTSLSKAHNAIKRFSEDIDLALSRDELGIKHTVNSLHTMPADQRTGQLEEIDAAGRKFVEHKMIPHLNAYLDKLFKDTTTAARPSIQQDREDALTLLMPYESIVRGAGGYVSSNVRLEFSVKSALTPNTRRTFKPFISSALSGEKMDLTRIPTISVARTFWDKVMIAHELKDRHSRKLNLTFKNERVSRHYYDLYTLIKAQRVSVNKTQLKLAGDCQKHSATFYPNPSIDLSDALPGSLDIVPTEGMIRKLQRDYSEMSVMIFGDAPSLTEIQKTLRAFEKSINRFKQNGAVTNR